MFKKLRKIATVKMGGSLLYYVALLYAMTFRLKIVNEEEWRNYVDQGGRVLLGCWHQQFFIGVRLFRRYRKYKTLVMISRSTDGDIASRVAETAGTYPVRGSSSRGGSPALKEIITRLRSGKVAVHLLDGPRGPAGVVKPGTIAIAAGANAAITPAYIEVDRAWYAHSWDKYIVPKPFARVTVTFCPVIKLPPDLGAHEYEKHRKYLEDILQPHLKR